MHSKDHDEKAWYISFDGDVEKGKEKFDQILADCFVGVRDHTAEELDTRSMRNRKLFNIFLLGLGFCFSFGSFQAITLAQTVILNSIHDEYFTGTPTTGYLCLAINFATMGFSFILSPAVSVIIGPKNSMIAGAACTTIAISSLVRPLEITLYLGSVAQGLGVGLMWTVYAHFLTENSTHKTMGRNTGIFWVLFEMGPLNMNLFYFFLTRGETTISDETRYILFMVVLPVSALSVVVFFCLDYEGCMSPPRKSSSSLQISSLTKSEMPSHYQLAKGALRAELDMARSKEMIYLIPLFLYLGVELTFSVNVYGTSLGYSWQFGCLRESLVGLHGVFLALGQLFGGLIYGLLGRCMRLYGRDYGIVMALIIHLLGFFLAYLVLPERSPFEMTHDLSPVPQNEYLAMTCSFLLGFGDAGWNNPLFALLGLLFPHNPIAAFAIFQAYQSFGNVIAFAYSGLLTMPYQLIIMTIFAIMGAFGFFQVEWRQVAKESRSLAMILKKQLPTGQESAPQITVL